MGPVERGCDEDYSPVTTGEGRVTYVWRHVKNNAANVMFECFAE